MVCIRYGIYLLNQHKWLPRTATVRPPTPGALAKRAPGATRVSATPLQQAHKTKMEQEDAGAEARSATPHPCQRRRGGPSCVGAGTVPFVMGKGEGARYGPFGWRRWRSEQLCGNCLARSRPQTSVAWRAVLSLWPREAPPPAPLRSPGKRSRLTPCHVSLPDPLSVHANKNQ